MIAKPPEITEIVLTGGPAGGKTTGLAYLSEKLRNRGFRVFVVPEVSTMFTLGGLYDIATLPQDDPEAYYATQKEFVLLKQALRERFRGLAACFPKERCVLLHDRGEMDTSSYMSAAEWQALCQELRLSLYDVRDSYDAVVHMVTVARDAPSLYTLETNAARQETSIEQAITADEATLQAWVGHPRLRIIDNSTDFEAKLRRALSAALRVLGEPIPIAQERKFLLKGPLPLDGPLLRKARVVEIEQTYLVSQDPRREVRLRRRVEDGQSLCSRTEKVLLEPQPGEPPMRQQKEEILSPSEYLKLLGARDPTRRTLHKHRYCFTYGFTYCELDVFDPDDPLSGLAILEVDQAEGEVLELPPLEIEREVTEEDEYYNASLASARPGATQETAKTA